MRYSFSALSLVIASSVAASPPPPPPEYVYEAANVLTRPAAEDPPMFTRLFAEDMSAFQNGKIVAKGKAAWLKWHAVMMARYDGRVLGYSESSAGSSDGGGDLLVVDTFDTVDRSDLPPQFVADPRMATRSTLYQFGSDHLIHVVRISRVGGFWITPRS
jgi:hypothetical protein